MFSARKWLVLAWIAILIPAGLARAQDQPPNRRLITGQQLLQMIERGQYARAETILRQQLSRQPSGPGSFLLGIALERQFQLTEAETHLRHAVALRPQNPRWRHALARVLLGLGRCGEAVAELDRCLQNPPSEQAALRYHYDKAMCALNLGDTETAEQSLRAALTGAEPPAHSRARLGRLLVDRGDVDAALPLLEQAVTNEPTDVEARFAYGLALRRSRQLPEAIVAFTKVLETASGHAGALYNLGQCLVLTGNAAEGRHTLERFRALSVVNDQIDNHRQFLQTAPDDLDARRSLARLQLEVGRTDEALDTLRAGLAVAPRDTEILSLLAEVFERQGQAMAAARARAAARVNLDAPPNRPNDR